MLSSFVEIVKSIFNLTPGKYTPLLALIFFTIVILIYSIFVFYFYEFIASKNILPLDLNKYNQSDNTNIMKFLAVVFYILEYLIIFPLLTIFWFLFFSIFVLVLAKDLEVSLILTISAAFITSIRITSYINSDLSKDLAKLLPLTLLALSITEPDFFSISLFLRRIIEVPSLISKIPYFIVFIVIVEFIMRIGHLTLRTIFENKN